MSNMLKGSSTVLELICLEYVLLFWLFLYKCFLSKVRTLSPFPWTFWVNFFMKTCSIIISLLLVNTLSNSCYWHKLKWRRNKFFHLEIPMSPNTSSIGNSMETNEIAVQCQNCFNKSILNFQEKTSTVVLNGHSGF